MCYLDININIFDIVLKRYTLFLAGDTYPMYPWREDAHPSRRSSPKSEQKLFDVVIDLHHSNSFSLFCFYDIYNLRQPYDIEYHSRKYL